MTIDQEIMKQVINKLSENFNKEVVTRQEILRFQIETGLYIPSAFWKKYNVGRGLYRLVEPSAVVEAKEVPVPDTQFQQPKQKLVSTEMNNPVSDIVSRFTRDSLIPEINPNYVEWGNYKLVEKMVASNKFFTLYVTGESGSGKNEMISHACAKLRRPMIRISITADTKEEHLIGSKTLVDGNIKYEEGPLIWAAENGALVILDEISLGTSSELMTLQNILEGKSFLRQEPESCRRT